MKFNYALPEDCHTARGVVIVIDALCAFSTAAYVLPLGVEEVLLVGTVEETLSLRSQISNSKVTVEVNRLRPDGFDFGNSATYSILPCRSPVRMAGTSCAI